MLDASQIARQFVPRVAGGQSPKGLGARSAKPLSGPSFGDLLAKAGHEAGQDLKFSKHAQKRLASRKIDLSDGDLVRIKQAVEVARQKGARDSLVLMDDLALVVSIKNNTVITAVDEGSTKENVFTNIDSAVIAR